ncbi:MAG: sortase [Oscillospiraceae bacterium]|nr:sortase [Oscillospiraceae bacterium]
MFRIFRAQCKDCVCAFIEFRKAFFSSSGTSTYLTKNRYYGKFSASIIPLDEADTVIPLDGYNYIGYLTFPTLGMELPVMDTWDAQRLRRAPCRYYGSAETHDLVIAAHNYRSSFGQCRNLQIGDEICFTDAAGIVHKYLIGEIEIVEPTAVEYMISSDWDLSLYTCTYSGAQRLTVRCTEQRDAAAPLSDHVM